MVRYCYIVVEGPQDVEFLIGLLKFYGLKRVIHLSSLDKFWETLIPKAYPLDDDLTKRVPVPSFVQNEQLSIALHSSIGITRIAQTIEESLNFIQPSQLFSVGIFLDADDNETPQERFNKLIVCLSSLDLSNLRTILPKLSMVTLCLGELYMFLISLFDSDEPNLKSLEDC